MNAPTIYRHCTLTAFVAMALLGAPGCGDDDGATGGDAGSGTAGTGAGGSGTGGNTSGSAQLLVTLNAEDLLFEGIAAVEEEAADAGTAGAGNEAEEEEGVADGWSVTFSKFVTTLGNIAVRPQASETVLGADDNVFIVDLVAADEAGVELWEVDDLPSGRLDFLYETPAAAGATADDSVAAADATALMTNDWTHLIEGTIANPEGQSCPPADLATPGAATSTGMNAGGDPCYPAPSVDFVVGANAETVLGPCEDEANLPGFSSPATGTVSVQATQHPDHLFFNGFAEGNPSGTILLAQWLADSDLDLDGTVTVEELEAISPDDLPEIDDRYQLEADFAPEITNMAVFLGALLKTVGHFNGAGECPVDGVED